MKTWNHKNNKTPTWDYSDLDVLENLTMAHFSSAQQEQVGLRKYFDDLREMNWKVTEGLDLMALSYRIKDELWRHYG